MYSKSDNIEIMINDETNEVIATPFSVTFLDIKLGQKNNEKVVSLSLIEFIYFVINVIK